MKTIFITSFHSLISRNILSTDVLNVLAAKPDLRIVIFVPDYKKAFFEKHFAKDNVIIEGIEKPTLSKRDVFFWWLARALIKTKTLSIHKKEKVLKNKNYLEYFFSEFLALVFGRMKLIKKLVRFFNYYLMDKDYFAEYFEKYQPNLVFITNIFEIDDIRLLGTAKKRKVFSVGMIRSWDNVTNKGLLRLMPDKFIVHNEFIKEEAVFYNEVLPKNIFISGLPQFDYYFKKNITPREEFFQRIGADPLRPLIMFAPLGNRFYDNDWQFLQILKESKEKGLVPPELQILVRFPPADDANLGDFVPTKDFIIDRPGTGFKQGVYNDRVMTLSDIVHLADSLYYSELIINHTSTLVVDAMVFGKPVIAINFDGWENRPYLKSVKRFYDFDHAQRLVKNQGFRLVNNKEELISWLNEYLKNPSIDREERRKMLKEQAYYLDDQSGQRIANYLLEQLTKER